MVVLYLGGIEKFKIWAILLNKILYLVLDVINVFGVETILIYTAVLLKKKIVFFSPRIETLLNVTRYKQNFFIRTTNICIQREIFY